MIFFVLSYLEESGFLAEFAFVSDFVLKKFGLSGRSIIPLLLGFGCTVSGTCAAKASDCIECSKCTLSALMFVPCGARLPLVLLFCNILFSGNTGLLILLLYFFVVLLGAVFHLLKKQNSVCSFVLEIPNLRSPSFFVLFKTSFHRLFIFLIKAGGTIVLTSMLIWFLKSFSPDLKVVSLQSESILYRLGYHITPFFSPLGIPFEGAVSLFCGLFSKESSLSAMVSLCPDIRSSFSMLGGISFILFYLIYSPCLAATSAIAKEYGIKTAAWLFFRQAAIAYFVSFSFYQVSVLIGNIFIP
ncbi:MAG: ferrous iron transporter B [Oscillospiraceae bacterium]|nr:ferrous iron transporter B [Oscillospiraceae bacterium]